MTRRCCWLPYHYGVKMGEMLDAEVLSSPQVFRAFGDGQKQVRSKLLGAFARMYPLSLSRSKRKTFVFSLVAGAFWRWIYLGWHKTEEDTDVTSTTARHLKDLDGIFRRSEVTALTVSRKSLRRQKTRTNQQREKTNA